MRRAQSIQAAVAAVACAWLWCAAAGCTPRSNAPADRPPSVPEDRGAALSAEIARLRDRNGPASPPRPTGRNLFEFMTARAPHDGVPTPALPSDASTPAPAPAMPAHGLKLVGLAEESDASGPVRTAIVSSGRELFFVKEGERVGDRYRVVRISGDAVELSDAAVAEPIRLVLK